MSPRIGLVLEGGGMRAAYSAGVLDCFLDHRVDIPYVIGVSAGANAGSNYVAGQRERNHALFVDFVRAGATREWRLSSRSAAGSG